MKPWLKFLKDEQGMTLVEVIVALVLFVFVFAILLSGINMALKVMGNAKATNDATLNDASKIESLGSSLEKENSATVTDIQGTVLKIKGYTISGYFKLATTKKSNDKTDLSLAFFDSEAPAHTVPLPTVPPEEEKIGEVVVPEKGDNPTYNAYYSPDSSISASFISEQGAIEGWKFGANAAYKKYDVNGPLKKGVITDPIPKVPGETTNLPNERLQQLYFFNNNPVTFKNPNSGDLSYCVRFIYFGNGTEDCVINFNVLYSATNEAYSINPRNTFKLNAYENNESIIMYIPTKLVLKGKAGFDWTPAGVEKPKDSEVTLEKGYYVLPSGTDILKAAYDEETYKKFTASLSESGYKASYDEVKERLDSIGVSVK